MDAWLFLSHEMYSQAKMSLKKYYGNSPISNQTKYSPSSVNVTHKIEWYFTLVDKYETYIT